MAARRELASRLQTLWVSTCSRDPNRRNASLPPPPETSNRTQPVLSARFRILYLPHASPPKAERPFTLQTSKLSSTIENHFNFSTERLSTLREISHTLIEQGARDDQPTGTTPRKRTIEFATEWDLTRPRDDLLREWKSNRPRAPSQLERLRMPSLEDLKKYTITNISGT